MADLLGGVHVIHASVSACQRQRRMVRLQHFDPGITHCFRQSRVITGDTCAEQSLPVVQRNSISDFRHGLFTFFIHITYKHINLLLLFLCFCMTAPGGAVFIKSWCWRVIFFTLIICCVVFASACGFRGCHGTETVGDDSNGAG